MAKELWEIELDLKIDKVNAAQKKYDESLEKIKQSEKRLTAAIMNEEKRSTASKLTELRIREATVKTSLAKEIAENKTAQTKIILDYKQAQAEKNRIARESAAQLKAQQKADSKFTGQSVELGSVGALTQQISYFKQLRDGANTNSREFGVYSSKVAELTAKKKELTGATGGLTASMGKFGAGLVSVIALQQAWNTALNSEKFLVMREMFQGSEKDIEGFRKATANTVTDASLLAISNQMTDLNVSIKDQTILFAFAETIADKYNTNTEEGFQRVLTVMQGGTKGLKDFGIVKTEFTALTEKLAQEQGKEVDEQIRLQAILQLTNMTYDDAINKQMDMADTMETVVVQTKNVADEHGNFWDILTSMNPVVGFFNVGLEDMAKKETKAKDDAMLLIGELDAFNSKIPGWGAGTEDLRNYFINLAETFLTTANTAGMIQDALSGTSINRKGGDASIPLQGEGKVKTKKSGRTGTGSNNTPEKTLTFLEQFRENIKKLEGDIEALNAQMNEQNIADYERLAIQDQLIAKQRELNELKRINLGLGTLPETISLDNLLAQEVDLPGMIMRRGIKLPYINTPDMRPDMTSEDFQALVDQQLAKEQAILNYSGQAADKFLNILQTTGLIDDEFMKIISVFKSVMGTGNDIFNILDGFLSFIPGGGLVSSVVGSVGGGGGGSLPNYTLPERSPGNITLVLKNPVSFKKAFEVESDSRDVRLSIVNG